MDNHIINERIRAQKLMVISEGKSLGVMSRDDALKLAMEKGLDLVLIAPTSEPPVAKILDYNKFLYEERKKKSQAKAHSKKSELKELRISSSMGEGDVKTRIERAKEFILEGNRVKVSAYLRGREAAYPEFVFEKFAKITKELEEVAKPEGDIKQNGKEISIVYVKK
jgi:translation initiation factor IF-3